MKVRLTIIENESEVHKRFVGISEVEIRKGNLELWTRNDEGQARIELSISILKVVSLVVFKHIAEKNMNKVKQRKAKIKRGPYCRSSNPKTR